MAVAVEGTEAGSLGSTPRASTVDEKVVGVGTVAGMGTIVAATSDLPAAVAVGAAAAVPGASSWGEAPFISLNDDT